MGSASSKASRPEALQDTHTISETLVAASICQVPETSMTFSYDSQIVGENVVSDDMLMDLQELDDHIALFEDPTVTHMNDCHIDIQPDGHSKGHRNYLESLPQIHLEEGHLAVEPFVEEGTSPSVSEEISKKESLARIMYVLGNRACPSAPVHIAVLVSNRH
jgi:hypothetical protein